MRKKNVNNSVIRDCITEALIILMKTYEFNDISIKELCEKAGVGRTSFYRNYSTKEEVLRKKLHIEASKWWNNYLKTGNKNYIYGLFGHAIDQKELIRLIYKHNLQYILLLNIQDLIGSKPEDTGKIAYRKAVFATSIFGLIDEWVKRGMLETAEELGTIYSDGMRIDINVDEIAKITN